MRLLGEAVERLKAVQRGETPPPPTLTNPAVALDLPITAYLPDAYIPDLNMRLAVYQRLAQATTDAEVEAMEKELVDRFGPLPPPARNLIWIVRLRLLATTSGIGAISTEDASLVIRLLPGRELDRNALTRKLGPASNVTAHMVRLDRMTLGEGWREGLVRAIVAVGEGAARVA